jgi:hypothetical protein
VLNGKWGADWTSVALIHELKHAESTLSGASPDPKVDTRDDYIRKQITEDADAQARAIDATHDLRGGGRTLAGLSAGEATYTKAYDDAVAAHKNDPGMTPDKLKKLAHDEGVKKMVDEYYEVPPKIVQSTDGKSYVQGWGDNWDKANRP